MKAYVQFLTAPSCEALGDRGIIVLDARMSLAHRHAVARYWAAKRGYAGYSLHTGSLRDHRPASLEQQYMLAGSAAPGAQRV